MGEPARQITARNCREKQDQGNSGRKENGVRSERNFRGVRTTGRQILNIHPDRSESDDEQSHDSQNFLITHGLFREDETSSFR